MKLPHIAWRSIVWNALAWGALPALLLGGIFFFKITPYLFIQKVLYIPKNSGLGGHVISF